MSSTPKNDSFIQIESAELDNQIRYLANDLGVGKMDAIHLAIENLEARLRAEERVKSGVAARLVAIGREAKLCFGPDIFDPIDELYDDTGMPH